MRHSWRWITLLLTAHGSMGCTGPGEAQTGSPRPLRPGALNQASLLGYNLDFPGDWTDLPPFIDLVKNSRAPLGACAADETSCDARSHLDLDRDGWPRSLQYRDNPERSYDYIEIVISSGQRIDMGERFAVTWEGSGSIEIANGRDVRTDGERRLTFTLQEDATSLLLTEINSRDHLRNIRVFRADMQAALERGELFNPEMLEFLTPFRSLRFMDWMASNQYGQCSGGSRSGETCYAVTDDDCGSGSRCLMPGHWDERPQQNAPSFLSSGQYLDPAKPELGTKVGGYPLEILVALANQLPADPHFSLPVDADEQYVRRFAEYLKQELSPDLVATIEYGNEVWNWGFPQAEYANQLGQSLWPEEGSAWVQYAAGRASTVCRAIKKVFGGDQGRVRCLLSPQTGWRELATTVLECPDWAAEKREGPCYEPIDAINITGYFAGCLPNNEEVILDWLSRGQSQALDRAFQQLEHGGLIESCTGEDEDNLDHTIEGYRYFADLAQERGLGLYVYESGTHFSYEGEDERVRELLLAMTQDDRMFDLYLRNFEAFAQAGGEIMNVWGWVGAADMWANADSVLDRSHPKYRAIAEFAKRRR